MSSTINERPTSTGSERQSKPPHKSPPSPDHHHHNTPCRWFALGLSSSSPSRTLMKDGILAIKELSRDATLQVTERGVEISVEKDEDGATWLMMIDHSGFDHYRKHEEDCRCGGHGGGRVSFKVDLDRIISGFECAFDSQEIVLCFDPPEIPRLSFMIKSGFDYNTFDLEAMEVDGQSTSAVTKISEMSWKYRVRIPTAELRKIIPHIVTGLVNPTTVTFITGGPQFKYTTKKEECTIEGVSNSSTFDQIMMLPWHQNTSIWKASLLAQQVVIYHSSNPVNWVRFSFITPGQGSLTYIQQTITQYLYD